MLLMVASWLTGNVCIGERRRLRRLRAKASCWRRRLGDFRQKCSMPVFDDGWVVASPREVGLDATKLSELDRFLRQWPRHNVHAVTIARRGKLVFERYFRGRERRWMEWSGVVE